MLRTVENKTEIIDLSLFGGKKLPYNLKIYAPRDEDDYTNMLRVNSPEDSYWKYITGTGGLTW